MWSICWCVSRTAETSKKSRAENFSAKKLPGSIIIFFPPDSITKQLCGYLISFMLTTKLLLLKSHQQKYQSIIAQSYDILTHALPMMRLATKQAVVLPASQTQTKPMQQKLPVR